MRNKKEEKINKERNETRQKKRNKGQKTDKHDRTVMEVPAPYVHTPLWQHTQRHSSDVFRKGSITNNAGLVGKKPTRGYSIPAGIKDNRL